MDFGCFIKQRSGDETSVELISNGSHGIDDISITLANTEDFFFFFWGGD